MTSVDTNLIVRLLTRDDEAQYQKAYTVFQYGEVFIPDTVFLETEWVLRYAYDQSSKDIIKGFRNLLGLPNVQCAFPEALSNALTWTASGMDFADALHLSNSPNCEELKTFDKAFVKKAKGCSDCQVGLP